MNAPDSRELAELLLAADFLAEEDVRGAGVRRIGRYEVLDLLGEGAAGQVFLARDVELDRQVAVKWVKPGPSIERLRLELQTLAKLQHPGVVAIHDTGSHEGRPYLVMAYAGHHTLAQAELSLRAWVEVLADVLETCDYVHTQGVVHRDLKPSNVIVGDRPAIADFGLAKLLESDAQLTRTGQFLGTPAYMAPEQLGGRELGPWTDIHAAGAMLYERLAGVVPYDGRNFVEIAARIADDAPPLDLRERAPQAPRALARVAMRALAKTPADRYARAGDMAADLRRWLRGPRVPALPAAAALAAGLLVLAVWSLRGEAAQPSPEEVTPLASAPSGAPPPSSARADASSPTPASAGASPTPAPADADATPAPSAPTPDAPPNSSRLLEASALVRWLQSPPAEAELATALEEVVAELPARPSPETATAFARLCWAIALRCLDERWTPPGALSPLQALSRRPQPDEAPASLVQGNAYMLRWWFERDADGDHQSWLWEEATSAFQPAKQAGLWEHAATTAVGYVLLYHKPTLRRILMPKTRELGLAAIDRLARAAPDEEALVAELRRRW